jgi:hypothetical protein
MLLPSLACSSPRFLKARYSFFLDESNHEADNRSISYFGSDSLVTRELPWHIKHSDHVLISFRTQLHLAGAVRPLSGKSVVVLPRTGTWSYVGCYTYVFTRFCSGDLVLYRCAFRLEGSLKCYFGNMARVVQASHPTVDHGEVPVQCLSIASFPLRHGICGQMISVCTYLPAASLFFLLIVYWITSIKSHANLNCLYRDNVGARTLTTNPGTPGGEAALTVE